MSPQIFLHTTSDLSGLKYAWNGRFSGEIVLKPEAKIGGKKTLNIRTPDDRAGGGLRFFERRTIALRNASGLLNTGSAVGLLDLPTKIAIRSPRALRVAAAWGHLGARRCSLEAVRYRA